MHLPSSLRSDYYRTYLVGVLFLEFAAGLFFFAVVWDLSQSANPESKISLFLFPAMFLGVYLSPVIGDWIDRMPIRNAFLIATSLVLGGLTLAYTWVPAGEYGIYALSMANSAVTIGSVSVSILRNKVVKEHVRGEDVTTATAFGNVVEFLPDLTTGILAGLAVLRFGSEAVMAVAPLLSAVAFTIALLISAKGEAARAPAPCQPTRNLTGYRSSFTVLLNYPTLVRIGLLLCTINVLLASVTVCLPPWAAEAMPGKSWFLGLLYSVGAAAGIVGSALGPQLGRLDRPHLAVVAGWAALGLLLSVAFLIAAPFVSVVLYFIAFAANSACFVHMRSQLVRAVPADELGRVSSAYRFLAQAGMPLGIIVMGWLASNTGIQVLLVVTCATSGLVGSMLLSIKGFAPFANRAALSRAAISPSRSIALAQE